MVKFQTLFVTKEISAVCITAEYSSAYSEKDFNKYPAISFPLTSGFDYKSGKRNFLMDTNYFLLEKGETEFTVSKYSIFKKDVTLSIQFIKPSHEPTDFLGTYVNHGLFLIQKRNVQSEILLRRFLVAVFEKNDALKEQILADIINSVLFCKIDSCRENFSNPYIIRQIDKSKDFIHAYYHQDLRITDIASAAHLSPFHFSRLFRKVTGCSPYNYLLHTRIEHAKALLAKDESITQSAFSTGFNSLENFSFTFNKIVGVSPSGFRKSKISKT